MPRLTRRARAERSRLALIAAAMMALAVPLAQGCATDDAADQAPSAQLVLPLVQPGPHGELYRLSNAAFDVTASNGTTLTFVSGSENQLVLSLPPGITTVALQPGWTLERSLDGGFSFQGVSALLGSPNPNVLRLLANQPGFLEFSFLIRDANGTLMVTLGVVPQPRELAGGVLVQSATGDLASYALSANRRLDFAFFYQLFSITSQTLDDGTKQHIYMAFGQQGSLGPTPLPSTAVAAEFYGDQLGILSGPIQSELAGGFLQYIVAARPDGSIELSGSYAGGATTIEFGPNAIDATLPTIGPDGFPNDEFFYDSLLPFTQTSAQGTLTGLLRMRHLIPTP